MRNWFINAKGEFEEFSKVSKKDINNIQETYRKKVELDEPIKYWSKSAENLRDKGLKLLFGIIGIALNVFVLVATAAMMVFIYFFTKD